MDQKQQKIDELKQLLGQAKSRLQSYRADIEQRDKKIEQLTTRVKKMEKSEQRIKLLEADSSQIVQQYEARLLRYQGTLEDNERIIQTHQKQNQILTATNKNFSLNMDKLNDIIRKATLENNKEAAESIEELFSLEKLKEAVGELGKAVFLEKAADELKKSLSSFISSITAYLEKKRQGRLNFVKRQMAYKKDIESGEEQLRQRDEQIRCLKQESKKRLVEHRKQLQLQKHEYSKKLPKDQLNIEYVKNLFLKTYLAPGDVSRMSLKVLQNILKLTPEEHRDIQKRLK